MASWLVNFSEFSSQINLSKSQSPLVNFNLSISLSSLVELDLSITQSYLMNVDLSITLSLVKKWLVDIYSLHIFNLACRYLSKFSSSFPDFSISHSGVLEWLLYNIKSVTCRDLDLEYFSPNRFIQLQVSPKFFWGMIFLIFFQIVSLGLILFLEKDSSLLLCIFTDFKCYKYKIQI